MVSATAYFLTGLALLNAGVQAVSLPQMTADIQSADPDVEILTINTPIFPGNKRRLAKRQQGGDDASSAPLTPTTGVRQIAYAREGRSDIVRWKAGFDDFEKAPQLDIGITFKGTAGAIQNTNFPVAVDPGSSGLLLGAGNFGGKDVVDAMDGVPGFYILAGDLVNLGKWVNVEITLTGEGGPVKTKAEVLAVTYQAKCPGFTTADYTEGMTACPSKFSPTHAVRYPNKSYTQPRWMGIGYTTNKKSRQPLRNVNSIKNKSVSIYGANAAGTREQWWEGYVFTREGLRVGLASMDKCRYIKLQKPTGGTPAWNRAPACVKIDNGGCHQGTISFTCANPKMTIRTPEPGATGGAIADGTKVEVVLGADLRSPNRVAGRWVFNVGDNGANSATPANPINVVKVAAGTGSHVTTGSRFFKEYDLCINTHKGFVGMRKHTTGQV